MSYLINLLSIPYTNWKMPRPQPLFAICVLSIETNKLYIENTIPNCPDKKEVEKILDDINYKVQVADKLHEEFLQKR